MKQYHLVPKITAGPGGIHCTCCNGYHKGRSQKATKQRINRVQRRKQRIRNHTLEEG
jgi:hypothetical protein